MNGDDEPLVPPPLSSSAPEPSAKTPPRDYHDAHSCRHGALRRLPNGEFACDACVHVALRLDGSVPTYVKPFDPRPTGRRTP